MRNSKITVKEIHPDGAATNINRNNGLLPWAKHYVYYILKRELISPQKTAETIIYLASAIEVRKITGKYFFDKKEIESSSVSYN